MMYGLFLVRSCCGCSLKFGSFMVLIIELVFQIIRLIILFKRQDCPNFEITWVLFVIFLVAMAFYGVTKTKPIEMMPYIFFQSINLILYGYFGFWAIKDASTSELWYSINMGLFYISSFMISFFSLCVVYSYYVEIMEGDMVRSFMLREIPRRVY